MKRTKAFLIVVLMLLSTLLITFSGCDFINDLLSDIGLSNNSNMVIKASDVNKSFATKVVKPLRTIELISPPMTDGEKNYFYFKLGTTENVPVYMNAAYHHDGRLTSEYEWKTTTISENDYTSRREECTTFSTAASVNATLTTSTSASVNATYAWGSVGMSTLITRGFEYTQSASASITSATSFANTIRSISQSAQSRKVTIHRDSPAGYYRYTVYATFDLYAVLICDIASQSVQYDYFSIPRKDSYFDTFKYSETGNYDDAEIEKIQLDMSQVNSLNLDLFSTNVAKRMPPKLTDTSTHSFDTTITTSNSYHISFKLIDDFELERLFAEGYKLKLTLTIKLQGKENCKAYFTLNANSIEIDRTDSVYIDENEWEDIVLTVYDLAYDKDSVDVDAYPYEILIFVEHNAQIDFSSECKLKQLRVEVEFYK